ncbi:MAG: sulfatase-like hydrolase/transferase [Planctomycetaceae bacterium]|nr:sulfatase-like hydrolase/transferase [Planctomycetaceae bacterium]
MQFLFCSVFLIAGCLSMRVSAADAPRPNILLICMDDLNDWIGCMGGHPQTVTPNLDRLAASGVLFTNAHCAAPACNPSRTTIFTGISPHRSGLYDNRQGMRDVLPDAELMPKVFSRHGYRSTGSGKLLHYFIDAQSWDNYFPEASSENPLPRTLYPDQRPVNLPRGGPWQYVETDWAPLNATDEQFGGDYLVSQFVGEQLSIKHEQPFFLACGIYRPHEPWFVPEKYFEAFPLESIQLPPGYLDDDLNDLPPEGKRRGPNRYFEHIRKHGQWKQAVQSYLASIHFADAMLGRVLDALEHGPNADNTIVMLMSDHGWHLGEKQHWQKYTAWRACTRVPLMVRAPRGCPGLAEGTTPGRCDRPVNLLSVFPTVLELCGLPGESSHDGPGLVPLLADTKAAWPHASVTYLADPGSFGLSVDGWRYIHYANGEEELYNVVDDPFEWKNLAGDSSYSDQLQSLRDKAPGTFAEKPEPRVSTLVQLPWHSIGAQPVPASRPDGNPFDVFFINESKQSVKLFWMNRDGQPVHYADVPVGGQQRQRTRPGAVWMIADETNKPQGYFVVDDRSARAIVPVIP